MNSEIILKCGPYLVKTNKYDYIIQEYGFSELIINGRNIKVICQDKNYNYITIVDFYIEKKIPRKYEYLELIKNQFKNGFGTNYDINFSEIKMFTKECQNYFRDLSKQFIK